MHQYHRARRAFDSGLRPHCPGRDLPPGALQAQDMLLSSSAPAGGAKQAPKGGDYSTLPLEFEELSRDEILKKRIEYLKENNLL